MHCEDAHCKGGCRTPPRPTRAWSSSPPRADLHIANKLTACAPSRHPTSRAGAVGWMPPELLAKVDERAAQMGMSRAACMSLAMFQWLEREPRG